MPYSRGPRTLLSGTKHKTIRHRQKKLALFLLPQRSGNQHGNLLNNREGKENHLKPYEYLKYILEKHAQHDTGRYHILLPWSKKSFYVTAN